MVIQGNSAGALFNGLLLSLLAEFSAILDSLSPVPQVLITKGWLVGVGGEP